MMTIGLTIGAAIKKVRVSAGVKPRIMSPRANGTLPHSHTGTTTPRSESAIRRAHARFGISRSSTPGGNHTCTAIESVTPRITHGSASMSRLSARVSPSCARSGRSTLNRVGAHRSIATSAAMTASPMPISMATRPVDRVDDAEGERVAVTIRCGPPRTMRTDRRCRRRALPQ